MVSGGDYIRIFKWTLSTSLTATAGIGFTYLHFTYSVNASCTGIPEKDKKMYEKYRSWYRKYEAAAQKQEENKTEIFMPTWPTLPPKREKRMIKDFAWPAKTTSTKASKEKEPVQPPATTSHHQLTPQEEVDSSTPNREVD